MMQVADRRRQHDDISRREPALQDQLPHKEDTTLTLSSARQSISHHERRAPPRSLMGFSPRPGQLNHFLRLSALGLGVTGSGVKLGLGLGSEPSLPIGLTRRTGFGLNPGWGFCLPVGSFLMAIVYRCFDLFRCLSWAKASGLRFSSRTAAILSFHAEPQLLQNAPLGLVHGGTRGHGHAGPGVRISRGGSDG
jgi:hypothetical protein